MIKISWTIGAIRAGLFYLSYCCLTTAFIYWLSDKKDNNEKENHSDL